MQVGKRDDVFIDVTCGPCFAHTKIAEAASSNGATQYDRGAQELALWPRRGTAVGDYSELRLALQDYDSVSSNDAIGLSLIHI